VSAFLEVRLLVTYILQGPGNYEHDLPTILAEYASQLWRSFITLAGKRRRYIEFGHQALHIIHVLSFWFS
jgi:hypothetical protein